MKKIISILLICSMLLAFLTGCSYFDKKDDGGGDSESSNSTRLEEVAFPEGYTGGSVNAHPNLYELYWFETYQEFTDAISRLEDHGSTVYREGVMEYAGDYLDIKYLIKIRRDSVEPLKEGQNPFERKADRVTIEWYALDRYVPVEELVYLYVEDYSCFSHYRTSVKYVKIEDVKLITVDFGVPEYGLDWPEEVSVPYEYRVYYDAISIYSLGVDKDKHVPSEVVLDLVKGFKWIGNTDQQTISPPSCYPVREYYWCETFEEVEEAVELLISYGNTIDTEIAFNCEGLRFYDRIIDCKYRLVLESFEETDNANEQNFLARRFKSVEVEWYAFDRFYPIFDRYSENSNVEYNYLFTSLDNVNSDYHYPELTDEVSLTIEYFHGEIDPPDSFSALNYFVRINGNKFCEVKFNMDKFTSPSEFPPAEFGLEFVKTFKFIQD